MLERPTPSNDSTEQVPTTTHDTDKINVERDAHEVAIQKWNDGDKIGAMEEVLGRSIEASEVSEDPLLGKVFLLQSAEEAYGGLLLLQTLDQITAERADS